MSRYDKKLEVFRNHYFTTTGKKLDDELLYIIIKMSEGHADLKKDIKSHKVVFTSSWDYFLFGLGSLVPATIMACLIILVF